MSCTLGKPVLIENITGAGGLIGLQRFLKSPPDGYTLFTGSISSHGINPVLTKNLPYDPVNDFVPISKISSFSNVLVVHPSLGVKTLPELVSLLKKQQSGGAPLNSPPVARAPRRTWAASCSNRRPRPKSCTFPTAVWPWRRRTSSPDVCP